MFCMDSRGRAEQRAGMRPEREHFCRDLFRHGVVVLACGGTLIEPGRARDSMLPLYEPATVRRLCLELLLETPAEQIRIPEVLGVAAGLLYHVGDSGARMRLRAALDDPGTPRRGLVRDLLAGLCSRLDLPLPAGCEALGPQEMYYLFGVL